LVVQYYRATESFVICFRRLW